MDNEAQAVEAMSMSSKSSTSEETTPRQPASGAPVPTPAQAPEALATAPGSQPEGEGAEATKKAASPGNGARKPPLQAAGAPSASASTEEGHADPEAGAESEGAAGVESEGGMSFAEMFELAEKQSSDRKKKWAKDLGSEIVPGKVVYAKVVGISNDSVFVDVGAKSEGVIAKAELVDENGEIAVKEGDSIEARVRKIEAGTVHLSKVLPHQSLKNRELLRESHRTGIPVKGRVNTQNKGGFDIEISGFRAFCPASQIDVRPGKVEEYVGHTFLFKVVEYKDGGRNIVVSRRVLLAEENRRKADEAMKSIEVDKTVRGKVTGLKDYGAFIDLGGIEGLVHLSEIGHAHIVKPGDALKVGDEVEAKVLKIEEGKGTQRKISLSIKALQADPWSAAESTIREGQKVTGKVQRIQAFGAFVELMPGVDGLIHISNMTSGQRIRDPRDVVKEGDEVEATVISTDWGKRRIGLSLVKSKQELANELGSGQVLEGVVDRIESFGIFVKLPTGARGLVPAAETGTQRGADLKKEFAPGTKVKVLVVDSDTKSGKIRLSIRAAAEAEERAEYAGYITNDRAKGSGLGTLGDLFGSALSAKVKRS
ncbi:MAG: S1 RNA-binding domain-containing protein [Deltaproteobacteria bacterium]|nr:S1 RNA-binding domain-containing protein [Deltaproteobacteria bacterium]